MSDARIRDALERIGKLISEQPEKARSKDAVATARLREALKCQVTGPKGETAKTDMPPAVGGDRTAPTPGWFLRASLASCDATVIAMRAAQLGVKLTTLEVTVESESDHRGLLGLDDRVSAGMYGLRIQVKIGAEGATPAQLHEIVRWAEAHSPVG